MQQSTITSVSPVALPSTELENEIRELQLEVSDLHSLVDDLLALASFPDHIVTRARRLIGDGLCAWCLEEQGITSSGSHGICHRHETLVLADARARAERRARVKH